MKTKLLKKLRRIANRKFRIYQEEGKSTYRIDFALCFLGTDFYSSIEAEDLTDENAVATCREMKRNYVLFELLPKYKCKSKKSKLAGHKLERMNELAKI